MRALALIALCAALAAAAPAAAQAPRNVRVSVDFAQRAQDSRQGVQGGGGVIIREQRGQVRARGQAGVGVEDTTTRVTRSSGLFLVVADGASGTLMVAQEIPQPEIAFFYDYALGRGYVAQGVAWQRVGTGLAVRPTLLPGSQIKVQLAPWLSYFTPGGGGSVELVEAATELVVPAGRRVQIGGASSELHSLTRRILGYHSRDAAGETAIFLTATPSP
jgi:hypothetical protein